MSGFLDELDLMGAPLFRLPRKTGKAAKVKGRYAAPPNDWPHLSGQGNGKVLAALQPAEAVGMVCGHVYDVLDVDPRHGGALQMLREAGLTPQVHHVVATPSGGWHVYVSPLGVGKGKPLPGLDLQASTGAFVLVPPTDGYVPLPRDQWPDFGPALPRATVLANLASLQQRRPADTGAAPAAAEPSQEERDKAANVLAKSAQAVAGANGARNDTVNEKLFLLYGFVKGGCLDRDTVDEALWEAAQQAPGDEPYGREEFEATRRSAWGKSSATRPTVDPAAGQQAPAGKKRPAAEVVAAHAVANYTPFRTSDGELFAVPNDGPPLAMMLGGRGGQVRARVTAALYDAGMVVSSEALSTGLGVLAAKASALNTSTDLALRVHMDRAAWRITLDLGQPNSTRCVVVTAEGWHVADHPAPGVFFRRPPSLRALPEPVRGRGLDPLRDVLGLPQDDARWHLVRGWLVAALLKDIPRPLLTVIGAPGSGKSTRGRFVLNVLDPRDELGSSFGRNLDDDRVKAVSRYLLGYDNLTTVSADVSDHVCRLVTGDSAEKRENYSDTGLVVMSYRRTGVLTAVTLPPLRADALERIIPVTFQPMPAGQRRSEAALAKAFGAAHPEVLAGVLDGAVAMLQRLPALLEADSDEPRMKDYALALRAYDPAAHDAYVQGFHDALAEAAAEDPLVQVVLQWMDEREADDITEVPAKVYDRMTYLALVKDDHRGWWPANSRALSEALIKASNTLAEVGVQFARVKRNGARLWRFQR